MNWVVEEAVDIITKEYRGERRTFLEWCKHTRVLNKFKEAGARHRKLELQGLDRIAPRYSDEDIKKSIDIMKIFEEEMKKDPSVWDRLYNNHPKLDFVDPLTYAEECTLQRAREQEDIRRQHDSSSAVERKYGRSETHKRIFKDFLK